MKFLKVASITTALVLSTSVNAVLISDDLYATSDGLLTHDTDTDLKWIDISQTLGMSYNQASSQFSGFRHATSNEVITMFANSGVPEDTPTTNGYQPALNLAETLDTSWRYQGINGVYNFSHYIGGSIFFDEANNRWTVSNGVVFRYDDVSLSSVTDYSARYRSGGSTTGFPSSSGLDYSNSYTGWYLVQDNSISSVPVPAAFWLFGSGLIGLVGIARRKKA